MSEKKTSEETLVQEENTENEKSLKISSDELLTTQADIITRIRAAYSNDLALQRIMNVKREDDRHISADLTKKDVRLELEDCRIENDLL